MEGKTLLRVFIVVSCLAVTALGYRNSNGDNSDAIAQATKAACASEGCMASLGQQARSSFGHEYSFSIQDKGRSSTVIVECKRELVLLGDWRCQPRP